MPPRRLCVLHHRHQEWTPALQEAEPRLEIRSWHPRDFGAADQGWLAEAEGLFAWKLPPGALARMPVLRWIQCAGAGVDHLLSDPEVSPEVVITRADGRFGFWMARYVLGHLLEDVQRIRECREDQAASRWNPKCLPENLGGGKALVVGFGRIGRQIGRALREIGMEVTGIVRTPRSDPEFPLRGPSDLPEALAAARVLVLAAPSTAQTRGLIGAGVLQHGNPRLTLINVGRGDLVDPSALIPALEGGRLGRVVLDVFAEEPLPVGSPLWTHPRVTVTPHHSGPSTPRDLLPDILAKLRAFAEGRPIPDPVSRQRGY